MTRIGYVKPLTFLRPRGPRHDRQTSAFAFVYCPLVSFSQLQGVQHALTPRKGVSPSVCSLTAPSSFDVTNEVPPSPAPHLQVFTTSWRVTVRDDLPVYSTRLALLGFGAFRVWPRIDRRLVPVRHASALLLCSSWFPSDEFRLSTAVPAGVSLRGDQPVSPSSPRGDRLHRELEPAL